MLLSRVKYLAGKLQSQSGRTRFIVLCAAALLAALPFFFAMDKGGDYEEWLSNKAMASTDARLGPEKIKGWDFDALINLPETDVLVAFSTPDLKRMEGDARIWQYRTQECVLDVYFVGSNRQADSKVVYYELRNRDKAVLRPEHQSSGVANKDSCLQGLIRKG